MSRTSAFVRGAAASYLTRGLSVLIGFVVTPIVLGYLGTEKYGVWVVIGSLLGYFGMLDLGVKGSAGTLIARQQRDSTGAEISRVASNTLLIHLVMGLFVLTVGLVSVVPVSRFFGLENSVGPSATLTLALALVALAVSFPSQTLKAVLRGTQQLARLTMIEFFALLLQTALVLTLLAWGFDLPGLPIARILTILLIALVLISAVRRTMPEAGLSARLISRSGLGEVFGISLWWAVGSLGALLIYQVDNLVIGKTLGVAAVTPYALTYRLPEIARQQVYQLNFTLMPGVGDLMGRGETDALRRVFGHAFRVTVGAALVGGFFLVLFNKAVVSAWVGSEHYAGDAVTALFSVFLVLAVCFHTSSVVVVSSLEIKPVSLLRCSEGVINLILSVALVWKMGVIGVALATVIAALVTSAWYAPWKAFSILRLNSKWILNEIALPLGKLTMALSITTAVMWHWRSSSLGFLLAFGAIFLCISAVSTHLFVLPLQEAYRLIRE